MIDADKKIEEIKERWLRVFFPGGNIVPYLTTEQSRYAADDVRFLLSEVDRLSPTEKTEEVLEKEMEEAARRDAPSGSYAPSRASAFARDVVDSCGGSVSTGGGGSLFMSVYVVPYFVSFETSGRVYGTVIGGYGVPAKVEWLSPNDPSEWYEWLRIDPNAID